MAALRVHEVCLALRAGVAYEQVTVLAVNKKTARVRYPDKSIHTVPFAHIWKQKRKKSKRTSRFCKATGDKYIPRSRAQRGLALARNLVVTPVCYGHGFKNGDFHRMLSDPATRDRTLCIFNDNTHQWARHGRYPTSPQGAGGGNACARPWQHLEHSIGMPTGPFADLEETHITSLAGEPDAAYTAKEIIDAATNRIVRLLVKHPEKETVYFSVDTPDSRKIGLAIFRDSVGDDVVDYISANIHDLPRLVRMTRRASLLHLPAL